MHGVQGGGRNAHLDKRTVERVLQKLDVLSGFNGSPMFQRGHPYLPDIARDTKEHLRQILDKNSDLGQNQYLQVTVYSLLKKTEQCIQVLSKQDIMARRTLTKLSLVFSHILCELRALCPGGRYQGNTYRIKKLEAFNFWSQAFGTRCLIKWEEFRNGLHPVHNIEAGPLESALRSTMDLTCNDHISMFEFDIFTRLFQPWETLLQNWMLLAVTHPGYMAFLTYDEVKELLSGHINKPGSYIFRLSCTHLGQWAIGYVTSTGSILQTIPHNKSLYEALNEGEKEGLYLYPNGLSCKHNLSSVAKPNPNTVINVTQEQWELYSDMETTFELCKICADNEKNMRLEPCGHLLCDNCLTSWQKNDNTCPFCRRQITGKEKIHIASPPMPEEHQPDTSVPQTLPRPPPHEARADLASTLSENFIGEEEVDWIRSRPLPPPPAEPALPSFHPSTLASAPPLPQLPRANLSRRIRLHAQDIINRSHN